MRLTDRLILWVLRSVATVMVIFGVSVLVAGVPVLGMLTGSAVARTIAGIFLQLGSVLVIRLQPFLAEWGRVVDFLATLDMWGGADANAWGLVLLPLAGALTPPLFELAATVAFVVASAALLVSLLSRSQRFPRIYLVCVVLLAALVIASVRGANAATLAGDAVEQLIEGTSPSAEESTQLREGLQRYTSSVRSTAPVLMWTLCGYLIWIPAMIFSRRVRTTFAISGDGRTLAPARATDIETITSPPRFPG